MAKKAKTVKLKRNKFGIPLGVAVSGDAERRLRSLRQKAASDSLSKDELKAAVKYFEGVYPDAKGAVAEVVEDERPAAPEAPVAPEGEDDASE